MRNFKTILWLVIIFLLQTVVLSRVHFMGAVVSLVLPYIICVTMLENEFRRAVSVSVVCALAAGALCGRNFAVTVLFYVYAPMLIFVIRDKPLYIHQFFKTLFWTFISSGVLEIIYYAVRNMSLNAGMLLYNALPTAVINTLFVLLVYPLLKKTMYKEKKKKLLIGDLV